MSGAVVTMDEFLDETILDALFASEPVRGEALLFLQVCAPDIAEVISNLSSPEYVLPESQEAP